MRKVLLSALFIAAGFGVMAQNEKKTDTKKVTKTKVVKKTTKKNTVKGTWKRGGMLSLAVAQGGTRNWAPGGERFTLSANGFLNLYANHTKGKCHWDNMMDANYGLLNTDKWGVVKNDDKLELLSKWGYEIAKPNKKGVNRYRVGLTANFRTQFVDVEVKGLIVHFSPVAGRWILVPNRPYELGANYGVKPSQEVKNEFGSYLSIGYTGEIMKNVSVRSRFDVYANYVDKKPGNMDLYLTNMIYFKINKCLGAVYNFDLQYDDDTKIFGFNKNASRTQIKSIFGLGLSYKF